MPNTGRTSLLNLLPNLIVPTRVNQHWYYSGIDSIEYCLDKRHFLACKNKVEYKYNSRGFRDAEWPDNFDNVIWCIGDSFTVGIGSPREHTWPYLLQQASGQRTINISIDGVSNNWISRTASNVLTVFPGATIVTHWSYLHRREASIEETEKNKFYSFYQQVRDSSWPESATFDQLPVHIQQELVNIHGWAGVFDEDRLLQYTSATDEDDVNNTLMCISTLGNRVIHSSIPNWASPSQKLSLDGLIKVPQLDRARDGHHYDIITARHFVQRLMTVLQQRAS
jgi:hypothetical protein